MPSVHADVSSIPSPQICTRGGIGPSDPNSCTLLLGPLPSHLMGLPSPGCRGPTPLAEAPGLLSLIQLFPSACQASPGLTWPRGDAGPPWSAPPHCQRSGATPRGGQHMDVGDRLAGVGIDDVRRGCAQAPHLLQLQLAWMTQSGAALLPTSTLGTETQGMSTRGCS